MATVRAYMITEWPLKVHVLVFIAQVIVFIGMWHMIRLLNNYLDRLFPFENSVTWRILLQLSGSILMITPLYIIGFYSARHLLPPFANKQFLTVLSLLFFVMILLLNFGFYVFYFFRQWQESVEDKAKLEVAAAQMAREKSMMQYHHLKNQVNPHFLFNTLTSLDGLIQSNAALASEFVRHLAKVYRYVLEHKENEVVTLQTELNFIRHYVSLLEIRYQHAVLIDMDIGEVSLEKGVVMVTLQMLIDNAIKHNSVHEAMPLRIFVRDDAGYLYIRNNKQLRKQIGTSNKYGLQQLQQLYAYLTAEPVVITDEADFFEVKLPLL